MLPVNIRPPTELVTATHPANDLLRMSLLTAMADQTVLPPAWVPHCTTTLRTYNQAVTQSRALERG